MKMETVKISIHGVRRKYVFYHISDAHVVYACENDTQADKELAAKHTEKWRLTDITPKEAFENAIELVNTSECDGIIMTGDCTDYYRPSIAAYMREKLSSCTKDVLYVYGNHEGTDYAKKTDHRTTYSEFASVMQGNPSFWAKEYDGFIVLGIDNSTKEITQEQFAFFKEQASKGLPIILLIHVPLDTPEIREAVIKRWGSDISQKQYFIMGFDDTTPETGMRFADFVKSDESNIKAIFSGHIHYTCEGEFAAGRMQFTAESAASGYIRRVEIVPYENIGE